MNQIFRNQVVAKADVPNLNKRIYSKVLLERIVTDFNTLPKGSLMGQLGMPNDSKIHFSEASHIISDLRIADDELVVDIQVMDTPCGKVLANFIGSYGINAVAFRLQGVGSAVEESDGIYVADNYKMITVNAVEAEKAA